MPLLEASDPPPPSLVISYHLQLLSQSCLLNFFLQIPEGNLGFVTHPWPPFALLVSLWPLAHLLCLRDEGVSFWCLVNTSSPRLLCYVGGKRKVTCPLSKF